MSKGLWCVVVSIPGRDTGAAEGNYIGLQSESERFSALGVVSFSIERNILKTNTQLQKLKKIQKGTQKKQALLEHFGIITEAYI